MAKVLRTSRLALLLASVVVLGGCGNGGDIDNDLAFRMIYASPDSPPVNFLVDGVALRSGVDYKGGTGFNAVTPRDYNIAFEAILPGDDARIIDTTRSLAAGVEYTYIAIGKDEAESVQALIVENPVEAIADGNARLQVVHAAPDAPAVDVYLTGVPALPAPLPAVADGVPLAQVAYGQQPDARLLVASGTYVIRVTPAGVTDSVLFSSGEILLRSRDDLLLVAVNNTGAGPSPISLLVNDRFINLEILDRDTPSELRVVHVSPDAPSLDVTGDPTATSFPEIPFSTAGSLSGIALDGNHGRALVVDNRLGAVLAVDLQSGVRTLLSDNVTPDALNPFRGPVGIAVDSTGGRALVAEKGLGALMAVDLQSGARTVLSNSVAPDAANPFRGPVGVALDSASDRALVVDNSLRGVLAVDLQSGTRTVLSDSVTPAALNSFSGPAGIALDSANGRALVADNGLGAVLAVDLQSGARTVLSNSTTPNAQNPFNDPVGIALDGANGRALVVDSRRRAVLAVDLQSGTRTVLSDSVTPDALNPFSGPAAITLDSANGRALVVDNRLGAVLAVDLQSGARTVLSASGTQNGLTYLGYTNYVSVPADGYALRGEKTSAPDPITPLFSGSTSLAAGRRSTVLAIGLLATIDDLVLVDDLRPVFAAGKLRIVDASPASGTVDVYIVATGTDISTVDASLRNLTLRSATSHLAFAPGSYTVTFTEAGTKTVVKSGAVAATAGTVQTAILVDEVRVDASSDGKPADLLLLNDLAAPPG